jgi:glycosyltransferase involved in cell wall biosynthesis
MTRSQTVALVYGTAAGVGGLGIQSANAVADLAAVCNHVLAFGPGPAPAKASFDGVQWHQAEFPGSVLPTHFTWLRWWTGRLQILNDTRLGGWAAAAVDRARPDCCYCFTQVALETLRWANRAGVPAILESPNGHIENYREVYRREAGRWGNGVYLGHPSQAMVERVKEEYTRADLIRVSSDWAMRSLTSFGVPERKVVVVPQPPTADSICPPRRRLPPEGRFRVCFVGTLDLRKGFVYLLRAARRFGADRVTVRLVGGTVDRLTRRLLARERVGLDVEVVPGDPLPALQWAELFVLPTLEDGSPFAVVEAMAAGVPLIVTDACGNAPLLRPGETGWVVPAGDEAGLFDALSRAFARRGELPGMGEAARADWELLAAESNAQPVRALLEQAAAAKALVG